MDQGLDARMTRLICAQCASEKLLAELLQASFSLDPQRFTEVVHAALIGREKEPWWEDGRSIDRLFQATRDAMSALYLVEHDAPTPR